jgi:hypothetical protein
VGYFWKLKKLPKLNNHPLGESSPNLVTLLGSNVLKRHWKSGLKFWSKRKLTNVGYTSGFQVMCAYLKQGCQMVYIFLYQKSQFGVYFGGPSDGKCFYIWWNIYCTAIWYFLHLYGYLVYFVVSCTGKNLATLYSNTTGKSQHCLPTFSKIAFEECTTQHPGAKRCTRLERFTSEKNILKTRRGISCVVNFYNMCYKRKLLTFTIYLCNLNMKIQFAICNLFVQFTSANYKGMKKSAPAHGALKFPCGRVSWRCEGSDAKGRMETGWPDWVNFRQTGDCLLWAFSWKFLKDPTNLGCLIP